MRGHAPAERWRERPIQPDGLMDPVGRGVSAPGMEGYLSWGRPAQEKKGKRFGNGRVAVPVGDLEHKIAR